MGSSFILLCMDIQFSPHPLKRLSFPECGLSASVKTSWLYVFGSTSMFSILFHWSMCVFMPIPSGLGYGSFVVYCEVRQFDASWSVLLSRLLLALGGLLWLPINFRISSYFCEACPWYFDRDYIESQITLGSMNSVTILILPCVPFNFFHRCFVALLQRSLWSFWQQSLTRLFSQFLLQVVHYWCVEMLMVFAC